MMSMILSEVPCRRFQRGWGRASHDSPSGGSLTALWIRCVERNRGWRSAMGIESGLVGASRVEGGSMMCLGSNRPSRFTIGL